MELKGKKKPFLKSCIRTDFPLRVSWGPAESEIWFQSNRDRQSDSVSGSHISVPLAHHKVSGLAAQWTLRLHLCHIIWGQTLATVTARPHPSVEQPESTGRGIFSFNPRHAIFMHLQQTQTAVNKITERCPHFFAFIIRLCCCRVDDSYLSMVTVIYKKWIQTQTVIVIMCYTHIKSLSYKSPIFSSLYIKGPYQVQFIFSPFPRCTMQ